jgi:hypothetical protein
MEAGSDNVCWLRPEVNQKILKQRKQAIFVILAIDGTSSAKLNIKDVI